ncbi:hypothetical protein C9439_04270 [archaeon SCG-AAA382B04]|nr:hypothetical protein C9439_04270 [archaeon SCG-AAA382B04]
MMSNGFFNKLFGSKEKNEGFEDYLDLSNHVDSKGNEGEKNADMFVKVAEIRRIDDATTVKEQIYNGNIVVMDIAPIKDDDILKDRVIDDMKRVTRDVDGDLAGLGNNQIIVTPAKVKVSREMLGGGDF